MILPKRELNVYPKTEENVNAVLSFYFDKYLLFDKKEGVKYIMENDNLSMNQIEFIARKLSECYPEIFKNHFIIKTTSFANIMHLGILGLTVPDIKWGYSKSNRIRPVIREFIEYVNTTEVDIDYLMTNN